jgi:transposase
MLTLKQQDAAGLTARGHSARSIATALHVSRHTLRDWRDLPEFQAELERVVARGGKPDPENTLLDALAARDGDGIRWDVRVKAALALLDLRQREPATADDAVGVYEW